MPLKDKPTADVEDQGANVATPPADGPAVDAPPTAPQPPTSVNVTINPPDEPEAVRYGPGGDVQAPTRKAPGQPTKYAPFDW